MKAVEGGVCAPRGFRASGVTAEIKKIGSTKKDCALVVSDAPATVAGTFTKNLLKAPPITWSQGVCHRGAARAIFLNSGNANACTGTRGLEDAQATAEHVALENKLAVDEVCVLSTGVIGVPLPLDRILKGVALASASLSTNGGADAAQAIMTTDLVPKECAYEVPLSNGSCRIGAMAKGSGMIAPDMATMFCILTTDASIAAADLQPILRNAVEASFNRICVDNDMSTSDAVICLANGQSGTPAIAPGTADAKIFAAAVQSVCIEMARALVKDGEGATKFVEIEVEGAANAAGAKQIARAIAQSQLCKTAFFGQDANWGRIACAAGYAGVHFEPNNLSIWLQGILVVSEGLPTTYEEAEAAAGMKQPEINIRVRVGDGPGVAKFWTCDLSHDYVSINADYRS